MLFASFRRRSLTRSAVALAAVCLLLSGAAWAQAQPATPRSKPGDSNPAETKSAEPKPVEATKPSESAIRPGVIL